MTATFAIAHRYGRMAGHHVIFADLDPTRHRSLKSVAATTAAQLEESELQSNIGGLLELLLGSNLYPHKDIP
jgi:hypothetical protein